MLNFVHSLLLCLQIMDLIEFLQYCKDVYNTV